MTWMPAYAGMTTFVKHAYSSHFREASPRADGERESRCERTLTLGLTFLRRYRVSLKWYLFNTISSRPGCDVLALPELLRGPPTIKGFRNIPMNLFFMEAAVFGSNLITDRSRIDYGKAASKIR